MSKQYGCLALVLSFVLVLTLLNSLTVSSFSINGDLWASSDGGEDEENGSGDQGGDGDEQQQDDDHQQPSSSVYEMCDNGVDDDGDSLIDYEDTEDCYVIADDYGQSNQFSPPPVPQHDEPGMNEPVSGGDDGDTDSYGGDTQSPNDGGEQQQSDDTEGVLFTVITEVVNNDGGTAKPEDFVFEVKCGSGPSEFITGPRGEVRVEKG